MKWLVLQSAGEHPENAHLRECFALQHAIQKCGHECRVFGPRQNAPAPPPPPYDIVLYAEQYDLGDWVQPDYFGGKIKIQWIVDLHVHRGYEAITPHMDIVLHATRSLMPEYAAKFPKQKHIWFPNAVDEKHFLIPNPYERTDNIVFVGSRSAPRAEILAEMERRCGMEVKQAIGQKMIESIQCAKIHFNKNAGPDLNYRVFESIALRACLLTDEHPDMAELGFIDGVNCLTYRDVDEAEAKCKAALADGSWQRIGAAGAELAKRNTYTERIRELLTKL